MAASKKLPLSFLSAARSVGSQPLLFALRRPSPLLRPLLTSAEYSLRLLSSSSSPHSFGALRSFSSRPTTSSLNDPSPNWSNRPPKETILLDGCDFEHWLVVMEPPDPSLTRDEIIDYYIKTLAQVLGSEEEARMSIYSVSTKHYFAFGAKVSEELSYKIKPLPKVRWVLPDSYLDVKNKDYGGEPFIDGKAVPYDPKYHEEWVRNNARANERSRRNDRPRNFDRSRNFERRRENRDAPPMSNAQNPMPPREMPPNAGSEPGYQNQMPNTQSSYVPNAGPGYQSNAQGYQGGPISNGPSYQGGGPGYPGGNSGYQGGNPGGNVTGGPSYHGGNPVYQTGHSGYQGGNPGGSMVGSPGYQGGNPSNQGGFPVNQGGSPGYQGGNPANQGANPGYQGGNPANQGANPGYQGGNPANQGGNPGYQGGNPANQGGNPGYQGGNPANLGGNPGYQGGNPGGNTAGGPNYHGGPSSYQGQNGGYQGGNPGHHGGGPGYQGDRAGYQGSTQNFRDGPDY